MSTSNTQPDLADVIADWRGDASVLRRRGDVKIAETLEKCAEDLRAFDDFTQWLSEADAMKRSGWSGDKVRRHARLFLQTEHVRQVKRNYLLRACIVPRRLHLEMVRASA